MLRSGPSGFGLAMDLLLMEGLFLGPRAMGMDGCMDGWVDGLVVFMGGAIV